MQKGAESSSSSHRKEKEMERALAGRKRRGSEGKSQEQESYGENDPPLQVAGQSVYGERAMTA